MYKLLSTLDVTNDAKLFSAYIELQFIQEWTIN